MIIKRVCLHNIRSYSDQEIVFPEGITLLSGDIGAGKSSILLAIEFALFGFNRDSLTGDTLLRHGRHTGYVELEFGIKCSNVKDAKEHNVIIKRNIRRANNIKQESGHIVVDSVKTECTPVELKSRILELLGYPQSFVSKTKDCIYRYTVYTPQEEMKQILMDDKEKRLETLRRVFDIDKYRRIKNNASIIIRELKEKKAELAGKICNLDEKNKIKCEKENEILVLAQKKEMFFKKLDELAAVKNDRQKEFCSIELKLNELKDLKNLLNIEKVRLTNYIEQKNCSKDKIKKLSRQILILGDKLSGILDLKLPLPTDSEEKLLLDSIEISEAELLQLKEKKINISHEIEFISRKIAEVCCEINEKKELTKDAPLTGLCIAQLEQELAGKDMISGDIKKLEKKNYEFCVAINEIEHAIKNADELKKKIIEMDKCPVCMQYISDEHKVGISAAEDKKITCSKGLIIGIYNEKKMIEVELCGKKRQYEACMEKEKKLLELKLWFEAADRIKKELFLKQNLMSGLVIKRNAFLEEKAAIDNLDLGTIQGCIADKKERLKILVEYKNKIRDKELIAQDIAEKEKDLLELSQISSLSGQLIKESESKITAFELALVSFGDIAEKMKAIREELEGVILEERKIEVETAKLEKESEGILRQINELAAEIDAKLTAKKELEKTSIMIDWMQEMFINLMAVMEKHIMYRIYNEFNGIFVNWFSTLMEDEDLSVRLDDEFTPVIIQNGYETTIESLSGGERTAVSLAYRLALNNVINGIMTQINTKDIIILDEPTDGFSHEQLDRLKEVLDDIGVRQIILVSHEPKIESFAEHIIRVSKDEHVSLVC